METGERIALAMAELLRTQGYAATGINQVARAAGAPTGSLYHHFRGGKREIAAAALRQAGAAYIQLLPMLLDGHDDLAAGIEAAFVAAGEDMRTTGWANMCPVGTVAAEIADTEPELREAAAEVMESWVEEGFCYLAGRGLSEADARSVVYALLTALEGAFLLARGLRSTEPFLAAGRTLATYVGSLAVSAKTAR
ncbi:MULTISPECIES: TetR/AcrR family transcriptional regulator [unclassified Streptomyces]|uniref:TetR/AcrR family transcriptional regulator n=1 Tax=unclassified Streptomyces TaxID=2593676 RepID=UPI002DDB059D|nr:MULTISPECIES: TetR/AcrR family transcriptional regulator [unclassified Streptomyces]WSA91898.1 TetR/AcrR family transcriptional regulator [Streptomyces sp. NBC_01795]WSB76266.1 TetR/AcrR family transcriptional regulator [Streptomyces sp. NBC_01775]WSS44301.1 TetR/AcrR family transcriptional regulator [Streptomyces sp. NBC_01187]